MKVPPYLFNNNNMLENNLPQDTNNNANNPSSFLARKLHYGGENCNKQPSDLSRYFGI